MAMVFGTVSCTKTIDKDIPSNEVSLLELKIQGQLGTAVIERDGDQASATVYIMEDDEYPYSKVPVEGIVVSRYATSSVNSGDVLNFSNPERRAKITVTSESGNTLDWWIYIKPYDAFYVGTWSIIDVKLHCNQKIASAGDGEWDTQLSGSEFGDNGKAEYDNRIIVTLDEGEVTGNTLTGTITNDAGADGEYANFYVVLSPYSEEEPLDMNSRLRHLLPPGTADWELNLTTNEMRITKDNVTSTMTFGMSGNDRTFRFILPSAANLPAQNGTYDNMWRSSTELFYVVSKIEE